MAHKCQSHGRGSCPRGHARRPRPAKTYLELLPCKIHYIERFLNEYDSVEDVKTPYRRHIQEGETRGGCLCDYYRFPRLLHERESLPDRYKSLPKSKINFLNLPPEIRNQIYEELLMLKRPIEFCPEPFHFDGCLRRHCSHYFGGLGQTDKSDFERADNHYHQYYEHKLFPMTAVMRTNKQIHEETSSIFYGQNVFSFSSVAGFVHLDYFLYQIGLAKCALLRKLIVCHPMFSVQPRSNRGEDQFARAGSLIRADPIYGPGFQYARRWWANGRPYTVDPILVLDKIGRLEKLGLVVPLEADRNVSWPLSILLDVDRFVSLDITLFWLEHESIRVIRDPIRWPGADYVAAEMRAENYYPVKLVKTKVHAQGRYATGWIENFADELLEIEHEEVELLAKEKAEMEAALFADDLVWAQFRALPRVDLEGL
ncbi:hypothetical protein CKM354_000080700 [Cercospora kikuchii]|uniref:DUF7730 domain-containing protein n=1 Tax=Cercospora kikuchii TaxID=84275 RepID=A0A9P3C9P3_9PEZI|nr:uncharacterized protein CKM354_000080700 [Cercospora kikuchii]GIZ37357.1 hypothetical protein CKM354_000080700 [Cercospora kikuchii]